MVWYIRVIGFLLIWHTISQTWVESRWEMAIANNWSDSLRGREIGETHPGKHHFPCFVLHQNSNFNNLTTDQSIHHLITQSSDQAINLNNITCTSQNLKTDITKNRQVCWTMFFSYKTSQSILQNYKTYKITSSTSFWTKQIVYVSRNLAKVENYLSALVAVLSDREEKQQISKLSNETYHTHTHTYTNYCYHFYRQKTGGHSLTALKWTTTWTTMT